MAKSCVGLDIGTSAIKVAQISRMGQSFVLDRVQVAPLPMGSIEGGSVVNTPVVAQTVVTVLHQARIRSRRVMAAVAGEAVIHRIIKMPNMPRKELDGAIGWESEKYIPFSLAEAVYDYDIVQELPESNEIEILLVAAQRSIIESHIAALTKARLQVLAIDVQPLALSRALGNYFSAEGPQGTIAVLDVGAGTSDLTIFSAGVQRFIRIIPIGGNYFTNAIAKRLNISSQEAESLKISQGMAPLPGQPSDSAENEQLASIIGGVMDELVMEIRRSIDYYHLQYHENVSTLVTTGGGIGLRNMDAYLAQALGLRVEIADPLSELHSSSARCAPKLLASAGPIFSVAIGLALRGVQEW